MADESSSKPNATIRARRWSPPPAPPPVRSYRLAIRLIGIPVVAVIGVFIFRGMRDHFVLPECDSDRAKHTLADVLAQLKFAPTQFEPIKTISADKDRVVCNAVLPLPNNGSVTVDYTFYWDDGKASMKYSISPKSS